VSYIVQSDHLEALHDGRLVESGTCVSDADAKKNSALVERGVLVKEPERHKPPKKEAGHKPAHDTAAAPQKEESK
jgi:hypothetical protein